jgi:hypothetical protein
MYRKGERPFEVFMSSDAGAVFVCAIITCLVAGAGIISRYLTYRRSALPQFRLTVMMNLVTVLLILLTGEVIVRMGSISTPNGEVFLNIVLKPKDWEQIKRSYAVFVEESRSDRAFLVQDDILGWVPGENRSSVQEGVLYASSKEKIRTPRKDVEYVRLKNKTDIALIGNSMTFGEEVPFEETWGNKLDQMLGDEYRVLNFGVVGYGLGQAYLRYETEVKTWNPKVVIFSFINQNLIRTMRVYPFVSSGWSMPFSKPRFELQSGEVVNINPHPLSPEGIFSARKVSTLPFIEQDVGYRPSDWGKRWFHVSYLVRLITSRFEASELTRPEVSEEKILSTNSEIVKRFIQSTENEGSIPLVVWLPTRSDLESPSTQLPIGKRMLEEAGIPYIDPTACLLELNPTVRFLVGHYSPQGNSAVANCIYQAVKQSLTQVSDTAPNDPVNLGATHGQLSHVTSSLRAGSTHSR